MIKLDKDQRILVLDMGIYIHKAIFASKVNPMPIPYTCMRMIIGDLKKVGVNLNDVVIAAYDGRGNWRRGTDDSYKANRAKKREDSGIDFDSAFAELDILADQIDYATGWGVIKIPKIECDDIMSVIVKEFRDNEIILLTYDADMYQLLIYPNVKIFNIHKKKKMYQIMPKNFNPYNILAKKVTKEPCDNLKLDITSKSEYDTRESIVNLLELPSFVEEAVKIELNKLDWNKSIIKNEVPCKKQFFQIFETDNIITYEQSIKKQERKDKRKKTKAKQKRLVKKEVLNGNDSTSSKGQKRKIKKAN